MEIYFTVANKQQLNIAPSPSTLSVSQGETQRTSAPLKYENEFFSTEAMFKKLYLCRDLAK